MAYLRGGEFREVRRAMPEPAGGEVRVRVGVGGINPADWRNRRRYDGDTLVVPLQDGAGLVDAVGPGVDPSRVGERVWLWEAARHRCGGSAQQYTVVPAENAVSLPDGVGLDAGACLGVPAVTAHRCLTVAEDGPAHLAPGVLDGRTVLVAGGAGAVGHATIQLARWSGATVIATVSTAEKAALAEAAGAHHVVRYRDSDVAQVVRDVVPGGVHVVVEVAPDQNAGLDMQVLATGGTIAAYAGGAAQFPVDLGAALGANARWQFVSIFTMPPAAKDAAVAAVEDAVGAGVLGVGPDVGLPLRHYPLADVERAFDAVEHGVIGKVLVDIPHGHA